MNRILDIGYSLSLDSKSFVIKKILGTGASSVTYLAECDRTEHVLKECNPLGLYMHREDNGTLIPDTDLNKTKFEEYLSRFIDGADKQLAFRLTDDLKNITSNVQAVYHANNTVYIDMTFFNGNTYDQVEDKSLYDLLRRIKALTQVIGHYHNMGYLHLDIKPQNIYTIPETPEIVMMFDFDSVVPKDDIEKTVQLSYTDAWAAPEQKMAKYRSSICEATDLFAIGEIIFYRIMGRHSTPDERFSFSEYTYDIDSAIFKDVNPRIYSFLTELFHKTLCCSPAARFQTAAELIVFLEQILPFADPKEPYLVSSSVTPESFFIGRNAELAEIHANLQKNNILFLSGIGGIGKSELAKNYAKIHKENGDYDTVLFATYNGSWMMLINDDSSIHIANFERYPEEKEPDYYRRKIRKMKELCDARTLFIIDNLNEDEFEIEAQQQWEDILGFGCKLLMTTRLREWSYHLLEIDVLSERNSLIALFDNYCAIKNDADITAVQEIIDYVNGHTLTVELIAKQTKAGFLPPAKMLVKLKEHGIAQSGKEKVVSDKDSEQRRKTAFNHIAALFDIAELSEQEKYVLANMILIPPSGIQAELFAEWCELEDFDAVNSLVGKGWVDRDEDVIRVHPVEAEVILRIFVIKKQETIEICLSHIGDSVEKNSMAISALFASHFTNALLRLDSHSLTASAVLSGCAKILKRNFNHNMAICGLQRSLEIAECYRNTHLIIQRLILMGEFYIGIDFKKSHQYLRKAKDLVNELRKDEKNALKIELYKQYGKLYSSSRHISKARRYFVKSLKLSSSWSDYSTGLLNLAILFQFVGEFNKAIKYYKKAYHTFDVVLDELENDEVISYVKAGQCVLLVSATQIYALLHKEWDWDVKIKDVLDIIREVLGETTIIYADALMNIGYSTLYSDAKQAEHYLNSAIEIFERFNNGIHENALCCLCYLAICYAVQNEFTSADNTLQEAQKIQLRFVDEICEGDSSLNACYQNKDCVKRAFFVVNMLKKYPCKNNKLPELSNCFLKISVKTWRNPLLQKIIKGVFGK